MSLHGTAATPFGVANMLTICNHVQGYASIYWHMLRYIYIYISGNATGRVHNSVRVLTMEKPRIREGWRALP
jgi:hypothetical protein